VRTADRTSQRRDGWLLLAVAAWTAYIWITRVLILARDVESDPAPVVHGAIAAVSLVGAVVVAVIGVRLLRAPR
jgi:hypothetical protein